MVENLGFLAPLAGVIALIFAGCFASSVMKHSPGNEKMQEISKAIQEGAIAFLTREYKVLSFFVLIMAILLFVFINPFTAVAFVAGAVLSATAGFIGLSIATRANARTTNAAKEGVAQALSVAFKGGAVMGMSVVGLGLLGLGIFFMIFKDYTNGYEIINGFALGASSIALFARVGGGIYTKAADVGADLVGKVEAGIPEDDPRNPAVIADNVGDNVGDVAGMGADLFESYVGSIIAAMTLGCIVLKPVGMAANGMLLPFLIAAAGIICSIIGVYFVRVGKDDTHLHKVLTRGTYAAAVLVVIVSFGLVYWVLGADKISFFWAIVAGLMAGVAIGFVTEVYTSAAYKPVKDIANSAKTGPATTILTGYSIGLKSTVWPVILVCLAIFVAYVSGEDAMQGGGVYGISLAALGMLATTGIVVGVDAYGPIADNAGGISEMAGLGPEVRKVTDSLDAVGNTTAAIAKGFAIGSAALTSLALFSAYSMAVGLKTIDILNYKVIIGIFIGAACPYLFASLTIQAVGKAAFSMIEEVRRQFREITGLMEGKAKADYASCVDISTTAALREMVLPSLLAVGAPLLMGLVFGAEALGGLLAGVLTSGFLMAVMMSNAGGAWDNAKKYIEAGNLGGKGSDAHKAAVVGDTVGDPFKDTAGPSMNILIKIMSIVALVFAPIFVNSLIH
ncbi:sodium-translocating pyrophosphatase [Candidatus Oleimmundimicrobium sp.]|uniref:sodium-translocating pyrophosphatase n=1 Tax=Candidatus Oleimmundimicrobium sp. TaxID=3060597 RepID=UPI00271836B9|nr:sodium-translocating pyrophosphatase [Candidatus Oleimmundimicrobium sp.]MDO8885478.1 sodium-translocating pyrophosphatase [Candidatus Oleimmundimicrobium sp.]